MSLTKLNVARALTGATPVANGGTALTSGFVNGGALSVVDQWRLTSSFTADAEPITSNLERVDTGGQGTLGSAMTESSGIFTFPSTGKYRIDLIVRQQLSGSGQYINCGTAIGTSLGDSYAGDISVAFWVNPDTITSNDGW